MTRQLGKRQLEDLRLIAAGLENRASWFDRRTLESLKTRGLVKIEMGSHGWIVVPVQPAVREALR